MGMPIYATERSRFFGKMGMGKDGVEPHPPALQAAASQVTIYHSHVP